MERARPDQLTAHEPRIAQLAAEGLANCEIGQRLYVSHRTVSTHLHRIFPQLGVASRAELRTSRGKELVMELQRDVLGVSVRHAPGAIPGTHQWVPWRDHVLRGARLLVPPTEASTR